MNDTVIIFCAFSFMCRAQLWAVWCAIQYHTWKVVCSQHFSHADFRSPECLRLNRMVVPTVSATSSRSHSTQTPTELTFSTPPLRSSSPLVACPDYLPVQKPNRTYLKLSITASRIFSSTEPTILVAVLTKMLVAGTRECQPSKFFPKAQSKAFHTKKA